MIGTTAVLSALLLVSLGYAIANLKPSRNDQDAKTALAAAEAGVDDYIARLNANDTYFTNNNADASNAAFTTGSTLAGNGAQGATYTYRVLTTAAQTQQGGFIRLLVTGKSRSVSRSLTAQLEPNGFLKYIYVTDLEDQDPALYDKSAKGYSPCGNSYCYGASVPQSVVDSICSQYYYQGRSYPNNNPGYVSNYSWTDPNGVRVSNFCREIQFTSGDTINGPLHSNDSLNVSGTPLFNGKVESSWGGAGASPAPPSNLWWNTGTPSSSGQKPVYAPVLTLPSSNDSLQTAAKTSAGCYYSGATRITFSGSSMTVFSPSSTSALTSPTCLNTGNASQPQTIPTIPAVIYVASTSANCSAGSMGFPLASEDTSAASLSPNYDCKQGSAYVSGNLSGKTTISAANDIVVTGDLTYTSATNGTNTTNVTDVLGLIANNYVWVAHPVDSSGNVVTAPGVNAVVHQVHAAVMALNHSFIVQNFDRGSALSTSGNTASKLTVLGTIIQKYRGPVGTGANGNASTGYLKNYAYDNRLANVPPPYFLKPQSAPWGVSKLSDG